MTEEMRLCLSLSGSPDGGNGDALVKPLRLRPKGRSLLETSLPIFQFRGGKRLPDPERNLLVRLRNLLPPNLKNPGSSAFRPI